MVNPVNTTPEDWDAEDTEFGYDGNGNVTTMLEDGVPAISSIQYDHRNLPVSLVKRNGDLVTYRYNASGQRIYKQVGSQSGEHYILDSDQTVAVYENGAVKYWNILANGVVGRYEPGSGNKFYYLKDHLGSTRAVINASGSVVEAHDYYPFGLLMPGREYQSGSETKEKFTGKEQDGETGLDYFGARYYSPALGRWLVVDPLADDYPLWSSYVYTLGNPILFIDPNGKEVITDRFGFIIQEDEEDPEDNSVYAMIDGERVFLEYRHGTIDMTVIFQNLLEKNMAYAATIDNPYTFRDLVKTKGDWDLKWLTGQEGRKYSIFAYGTKDQNQTTYIILGGLTGLQSQDLGNIHFGATGLATGLFTEETLLREAGLNQIVSDYYQKGPESIIGRTPIRSPYGDDPRDQYYINIGFVIQGHNPPSGPIKSTIRALTTKYSRQRAQEFLNRYPGLRK
ncbi:MAG: hypothetical protein D6732_24955 [Methanobacteriota archaeon]|nr:MAG: hypothetical protein D6732_24955 [Euryarchaeota archaeon]